MLKAILIDDEQIVIEGIKTIVDWEKLDIELVATAYNGKVGLNLILEYEPDIVITDIQMPVMDGLELIEEVNQLGMDVHFLVLSGYGEFSYTQKAIHFGVKEYLLKPCNQRDIEEALQNIAKKVSKHQEKIRLQEEKIERIYKNLAFITNEYQMLFDKMKIAFSFRDKEQFDALLNTYFQVTKTYEDKKGLYTQLILKVIGKEYLEQAETLKESFTEEAIQDFFGSFFVEEKENTKDNFAEDKTQVAQIKLCVEKYLNHPDLSLKWIAQNYIFMSPDYLSKQFVKITGEKFSNYLNRCRIQKALELMHISEYQKVYEIADQVGLGHNPQYFSQIFKKYTGYTPSEYQEHYKEESKE
jgi:two-component system response regulator YesN